MKHSIVYSADGSHTLKLSEFDECFHSSNGAYTEAEHIYIKCGIEFLWEKTGCTSLVIYDIGLGTALNCMAALVWQQNLIINGLHFPHIIYKGIEKYPISMEEASMLNFPEYIAKHNPHIPLRLLETWFETIHSSIWEEEVNINPHFTLIKHKGDISTVDGRYFSNSSINASINSYPKSANTVIMYDTFSPATQPHLWDVEIFKKIAENAAVGTILTTYCSKGIVKQALRDAGFSIERLQGPPGKRHILRATLSYLPHI